MTIKSIGGELAQQALDRFPTTPSLTLAKKLFKENNSVFPNVDAARSALRYIRQTAGSKRKAHRVHATGINIPKKEPVYNPFVIPESDNVEWLPFELKAKKILILSDIHFPYHDKQALELALEYGLKIGCDSLLINGDLMDFYGLSRFDKDPRKRGWWSELEMSRNFLKSCSQHFNTFFKLGNHDERWEKYMFVKAPELLDVPDFKLEILLKAGENKIKVIDDKKIIHAGHLNILHGHEFLGATSQAVNPARGLFMKTNESCLIGHLHKSSEHVETTLNSKLVTTWSTGCLCDMHPEYARINRWNLGFAVVEIDTDRSYRLQNKRIYQGKIL